MVTIEKRLGNLEQQLDQIESSLQSVIKSLNDVKSSSKRDLQEEEPSETSESNKVFPEDQANSKTGRLAGIKKAWFKFATATSFHGIPSIANNKSLIVKSIWLLLLLLSVSVGLVNICETVNDYYQFDVITNVERVNHKNITFPAITICLKDFYRITYKKKNSTEYEINFNQTLSLFLRNKTFKGSNLDSNSRFETFKIPKSYGNCLRFNGFAENQLLEIAESKSDTFSFLVLKDVNVDAENKEYAIHEAMEVYVTGNYLNSYLSVDPLNLDFKEDRRINIVKAEIETKLGEPYNKCSDSKGDTYHQMNCIEKCINTEIQSKHNCSIPSYFRAHGLAECGGELAAYKSGLKSVESKLYEDHIADMRNLMGQFYWACEKECAKECRSVLLNTQVYSSVIGKGGKYFAFSISDFSSLHVQQIPKMSGFSFISDIGGCLGLFIGISFLSFAEVLQFLIEVLFICVQA